MSGEESRIFGDTNKEEFRTFGDTADLATSAYYLLALIDPVVNKELWEGGQIWGILNKVHSLAFYTKREVEALRYLVRATLLQAALLDKDFNMNKIVQFENTFMVALGMLTQGREGQQQKMFWRRASIAIQEKAKGLLGRLI